MSTLFELVVVSLLVIGCFFTLLGGIAMVKLSDFFRRLHGPAKASTLGVGCILIASIVYHWVNGSGVHPRELLITVFLFLTAPVSAHMMAKAALSLAQDDPPPPPPGATSESVEEGEVMDEAATD